MSYNTDKTSYFRRFWQKQGTAVAGTWAWTTSASQTDFASVTGEGAGFYYNSFPSNDLDEYKWSNIFLIKGTYKITIIYVTGTNRPIVEVLFGTTSLGTKDYYGAIAYNQVWEITFTLSADTTADLRFRANGKNPLSTDERATFSRFQIEKTG